MKKFIFTMALAVAGVSNAFALSNAAIRENARFLSDRMAYELNLSMDQYEDCYEINYDFIDAIDPIMDEAIYGYQDAIDRYYDYLDWRNDDLRMIMTATQFARFCDIEYFYRPIYMMNGSWMFRVRSIYSNHSYYYYSVPRVYHSYYGGHSRFHHTHGFYSGRYHHQIAPHYNGFRHHHGYHDIHHHDFGHNRHDRPAGYRWDDHHPNRSHNVRHDNHGRHEDHGRQENHDRTNDHNRRNDSHQRNDHGAQPRHETRGTETHRENHSTQPRQEHRSVNSDNSRGRDHNTRSNDHGSRGADHGTRSGNDRGGNSGPRSHRR